MKLISQIFALVAFCCMLAACVMTAREFTGSSLDFLVLSVGTALFSKIFEEFSK